jgi:hypothetical protein
VARLSAKSLVGAANVSTTEDQKACLTVPFGADEYLGLIFCRKRSLIRSRGLLSALNGDVLVLHCPIARSVLANGDLCDWLLLLVVFPLPYLLIEGAIKIARTKSR